MSEDKMVLTPQVDLRDNGPNENPGNVLLCKDAYIFLWMPVTTASLLGKTSSILDPTLSSSYTYRSRYSTDLSGISRTPKCLLLSYSV